MKKVYDFIKTHKYAVIWTACYACIMWAILYFLFNFNLFNGAQWHRLIHAQLRGFPGFVFGILILAALPLYIATTTLIIRNKKPLITITIPKLKIPEFLKPVPIATPADTAAPESETPTPAPDETNSAIALPDELPAELRNAFIRARDNIGRAQTSAFNTIITPSTPSIAPEPEISNDAFPLPTDFDIDTSDMTTPDFGAAPTFTEINFDSTPNTPPPEANIAAESTVDNSELIEHLTQSEKNFFTDGEIIITDTHAIATHSDSDFWVTDTENWFAAGKTCPSPIIAAKNAAAKHTRTPAIFLASKNIMDLDSLIPAWRADGITVITDLTEI